MSRLRHTILSDDLMIVEDARFDALRHIAGTVVHKLRRVLKSAQGAAAWTA